MIRWQTLQNSAAKAVWSDTPQFRGRRVPLIESAEAGCSPQAKIIEQASSSLVAPHYHRQFQFQIVTAGSGTIGRTPVQPLTVHYSSPETGYGPITAGPEGLSYYVLRPGKDAGAMFLPQARDRMTPGLPKHHAMSRPVCPRERQALRQLAQPVVEPCLAPTPEGMAVWRVGLPPGSTLVATALAGDGPRFYYVVAGAMALPDQVLEAGSVCFVHAEDDFRLQADQDGVELLVLQFPAQAVPSA